MKLLLDTCVLAEFSKPLPEAKVLRLIESHTSESLFISVISLGEISKGVHLLTDSKRKTILRKWLSNLEASYQGQVLSITSEIAQTWGEVTAQAQQKGRVLSSADGLIAATAIVHGLHVITRNVKDFALTPVLLMNPWD